MMNYSSNEVDILLTLANATGISDGIPVIMLSYILSSPSKCSASDKY